MRVMRARVRSALSMLRQVAEGLGHPAYGCCSGDPIAWEKDLLRMRAEAAEQAAGAGAADSGRSPHAGRAAEAPASALSAPDVSSPVVPAPSPTI